MDNVVDTLKIEAESDVGKAESGLNRLISTLEKFKNATSGTNKGLSKTSKALDAIDAVMAKIESGSIGKLRALSNGIKSLTGLDKIKLSAKLPEQLTNIGAAVDCLRDVDFSKLDEMAAGLAALKDAGGGQLPNLSGVGTNVPGGASAQVAEIQAAAEKATAPVKRLTSEIDKASDSTSNLTKNIKNTGKAAKAAAPRLGGFFSSIVRIAKYRFIRFVLKEITQGLKEGMDACYQYSKTVDGNFARSMDSIATSFKYLRNSLGAMISPILIALAPIIEIAVDKFVDLLNIINQVFSRLSGSSTWTRAVRYPIEYAEAADAATEANRKLKNSILGMDEINPLTDNSYGASGNAGNSNNYGLQFVTEQIDTTMVDALIDKLKVVAKVAAIVAGVFLTWKLAKGFISGITTLLSLFGIASPGDAFTVPSVGTTLKGLADLGLIVLGVIGLIEILGLLTKIPGFESTARDGISLLGIAFKGIWDIILPLTVASAGIVLLGKLGVATIAKGFADLAIIIGGIPLLITAVGAVMSIPYFSEFLSVGLERIKQAFNGIMEVAIPIGVVTAALVALGFVTPAVVLSGLAGFALVIGGLELVLIALGELNQIPGFSWLVGEGGKVLVQLGEIIGDFAGSIIANFVGKATEGFADVGTNLAKFMENAEPFFSGLDQIDEGTANAAKALAACILELTAASVLDGLTSWITGGKSLEKFGEMLPGFGKNMKQYSKNVEGIDAAVVEASASAAKSIIEFARIIPNSGGLWGLIAGNNDLDEFGAMLPGFGKNMKAYSDNLAGFKPEIVEASANAAKSIIEFARIVPNSGGLWGLIAGNNDLDEFGAMLPEFGKHMRQYSDNVAGVKPEVVETSANAAKAIAELANNLPNSGGIVSWFTGDNRLDKFGEMLSKFGKHFKTYYEYISGFKSNILTTAADAIESIVQSAIELKTNGATNTIKEFGTALKKGGADIAAFLSNNFSTSKAESYGKKFGKALGDAIVEALKKTVFPTIHGSISSSGANVDISFSAYASGGFPTLGEMFIAREAGPEIVGRIGRRTAVMNNDQIVESVSVGVSEANAEQNALLREEISILRQLLAKENSTTAYVSTDSLVEALSRKNRRDGKMTSLVGV